MHTFFLVLKALGGIMCAVVGWLMVGSVLANTSAYLFQRWLEKKPLPFGQKILFFLLFPARAAFGKSAMALQSCKTDPTWPLLWNVIDYLKTHRCPDGDQKRDDPCPTCDHWELDVGCYVHMTTVVQPLKFLLNPLIIFAAAAVGLYWLITTVPRMLLQRSSRPRITVVSRPMVEASLRERFEMLLKERETLASQFVSRDELRDSIQRKDRELRGLAEMIRVAEGDSAYRSKPLPRLPLPLVDDPPSSTRRLTAGKAGS